MFCSLTRYSAPASMFSRGFSRSSTSYLLAVPGIICIRPKAPRGDNAWILNFDSLQIRAANILQSQPIFPAPALISSS